MKPKIPPLSTHVERLKALSGDQIDTLSSKTGIGVSTIWKIRHGTTKNPGYETIALLLKHIPGRKSSHRGHSAARAAIAACNTAVAPSLRVEKS